MLRHLAAGLAGAATVTLVHETMRRILPHAPRVDVIGTRALRRPIVAAGRQPPHWDRLHRYALAGDIAANTAYYSLTATADSPEATLRRGLALGVIGGVGAALLPPVLGLGRQPHRQSPTTELLTIAWYTLGGLAAAAVANAVAED